MAKTNTESGLPKGEIKFAFQLDNEQKEAKKSIIENLVTVITGRAGTGKSSLLAQAALDLNFKHGFKKIWLTRPTVELGKTLGLLPGSLEEKIDPYVEAFKDSLRRVYNHPEKIDKMLESCIIENFPIQFAIGKNIHRDTVLIIDESQLTTEFEMEELLTRLNEGSKCIIVGDTRQKEKKDYHKGLEFVLKLSHHMDDIKHIHLTQNHRHGFVGKLLDHLYGKESK